MNETPNMWCPKCKAYVKTKYVKEKDKSKYWLAGSTTTKLVCSNCHNTDLLPTNPSEDKEK